MMEKTLFQFCPKCHHKFAQKDQHQVCNLCLPIYHRSEYCNACAAFKSKTLRVREKQRQAHYAMQGQKQTPSRRNLRLSSDEEVNAADGETSDTDLRIAEGRATKKDKMPLVTQNKLPEYRKSGTKASKEASLSKLLTKGRPRDQEPLGSVERDTAGGQFPEETHSLKDRPRRGTLTPKQERSWDETRSTSDALSKVSTAKRKGSAFDPEECLAEMERKKRRLEAEMASLMQKKRDFDASLKELKTQKTLIPKDQAEKDVEDIGPPMTPETHEEETFYEEEKGLGMFQGSEDSEYAETQWYELETDSPEEGVDCYPSRPSPPDDIGMYNRIIKKAADKYGVQLEEERSQSCFLLETLIASQAGNQYLPMLPSVLDQGREAFKEPATCRAVTPRVEKKYKYSSKDPAYIKGTVPADSITSTARQRANIPSTSGPPRRESKKMDLLGRKFERSAAYQWRIANSNALLNRHAYQHWEEMADLMKNLPEQYKNRAANLAEEGKNIANICLKSAFDAANTASRQMMTGISLRRHSWLKISGFKPEVQAKIINAPFNGEQLFGSTVDDTLNQLERQ